LGQIPLCIAAFLAVYFVLDLPKTDHSHWRSKISKIDFLGALTLVLAVIALLVGLDSGSNAGWSATLTIVSLSLTPILFALFLLVEIRVASHPFAPGHIIFDRSLFACFMANFFGVAGQLAPLFFIPLFYQAVMGYTATQSGLLLIPPMLGGVTGSIGGGLVLKWTGRYYWVTVFSFALLLLSIVPLVISTWFKSTVGLTAGMILVGLGAGSGSSNVLPSSSPLSSRN
jgi:predicted MFS family arabinose efflux permease